MQLRESPSREALVIDSGVGLSLGVLAGMVVGPEIAEAIPHYLAVHYLTDQTWLEIHETIDLFIQAAMHESSNPMDDFVAQKIIAAEIGGIQGALVGAAVGLFHAAGIKFRTFQQRFS